MDLWTRPDIHCNQCAPASLANSFGTLSVPSLLNKCAINSRKKKWPAVCNLLFYPPESSNKQATNTGRNITKFLDKSFCQKDVNTNVPLFVTACDTGGQLLKCDPVTLKMEVASYTETLAVSTKLLDVTPPKTVSSYTQYQTAYFAVLWVKSGLYYGLACVKIQTVHLCVCVCVCN